MKLKEIAKVIRSKNAGPFEITFDIMFADEETYNKVKSSGVLTQETICSLYRTTSDQIVSALFFDPALAYKFTLKRSPSRLQGSIGENDTFGTQQHAPLMDIEFPDWTA